MATGGDLTLADREIEDLAQVIVMKHMATVAIKYLGLPYETVENQKLIRQGDSAGFNRDLLILWRNKNPGINQVQVSQKVQVIQSQFVSQSVLTYLINYVWSRQFGLENRIFFCNIC